MRTLLTASFKCFAGHPAALLVGVLSSVFVAGCATPSGVSREAPDVAAASSTPQTGSSKDCPTWDTPVPLEGFTPPADLWWARGSAERKTFFANAYDEALRRVMQRKPPSGPWAVIIDADETILDNSEFQEKLARTGCSWGEERWNPWAERGQPPAFPEAVAFLKEVRKAHGRIAIVTNRDEPACANTQAVLDKQGVPYDVILCAQKGSNEKYIHNKEPRFADVVSGRALKSSVPVQVVLYVGDNIEDCSGQSQTNSDPTRFREECILLPNPMYGSWTRVPYKPAGP